MAAVFSMRESEGDESVPQHIVVMTDELASKIAAGEVVERPASIVKELVENALDANADDIRVELIGGGKTSIKIIDNGEGMSKEDAALAFQRYATSKIKKFEDIYEINSFGFRGEALPSIASISRIEMLTRRKNAPSGTRVVIEAGQIKGVIDAGCPIGTSITVTDIFSPTPVRRKFLKKDITEQSHCMDVIVRSALAHPPVSMTVTSNGKEVFSIPKAVNYEERIALLYGSTVMKQFIKVENTSGSVELWGMISKPIYTRSNTKGIFYFVNGRYIRDRIIHNAIMTSYRRLIEPKRFPSVILFFNVLPSMIDVNVHPAKTEIRFKNPGEMREMIIAALSAVLGDSKLRTEQNIDHYSEQDYIGSDKYKAEIQESLRRYTLFSDNKRLHYVERNSDTGERSETKETLALSEKGKTALDYSCFSSLEYVTEIDGTYLIFRDGHGLVIIDQHAAHERILYEKMKKDSLLRKSARQELVLPEIIDLTPAQFSLIMNHADIFRDMGFDVNQYGDKTVILKSVPSDVHVTNLTSLIHDMIIEIESTGKSSSVDEVREKILILTACKSAVKAHHRLSPEEVENLLKDLDSMPNVSTCPHGRPLYIRFDTQDLEKLFRRR